jgi:hypothetical protein
VIDPAGGMAMSFALGTVLVAMTCVVTGIGAAIVGPNAVKVRRQANESAAIESLRTIVAAELAFQEQDLDRDGARNFATLDQLGTTRRLDPDLASGLQHRYVFEVGVSGPLPTERWMATASPVGLERSSGRHFATNHTGAIYFKVGHPFKLDLDTCEFPVDASPVGAELPR